MPIYHPHTRAERMRRDLLLTAELRPEGSPFAIAAEYPLVLGDDGAQFSFCLGEPEAPLAHANLWPRRLISSSLDTELNIGLIGNVATASDHRGQGLMRSLFTYLKDTALAQGLGALVLWSDLYEFYQKIGFTSCSGEARYLFRSERLRTLRHRERFEPSESPTLANLAAMIDRRYPVTHTLARSPEEFRKLLTIPALTVLVGAEHAYVLLGKGCDMVAVVHEWGAATPETLLAGVLAAAEAADLPEIMLLAPARLALPWEAVLRSYADAVTNHPMALAWCPTPDAEARLSASFIWGLDSI